MRERTQTRRKNWIIIVESGFVKKSETGNDCENYFFTKLFMKLCVLECVLDFLNMVIGYRKTEKREFIQKNH